MRRFRRRQSFVASDIEEGTYDHFKPADFRPDPGQHLTYWLSRLGVGALVLLLANAGVLILFFTRDVTLFQLVLVYWCECVWIGIFSAIKLIVASIFGDPYNNRWAEVTPGASVFWSLFVIFLSSTAFISLLGFSLMAILFANDVLALSSPGDDMLNHIGLILGTSCLLMTAHALSFITNFLLLGEFRIARVGTLVALPFKRCLALFFAILISLGCIALLPRFSDTAGFAALVIALKSLWDLWLHVSERRAMRR
jgi:Family of unknown function (DUF6498)